MPPRKKTRRARFTPRTPSAGRLASLLDRDPDDVEGEGDWDADGDDEWEDLDHLEKLLDDLEASRRSSRSRAVRVDLRRGEPGPLARAWIERAGECGAGELRRRHGEEALQRGALVGLFVQRGRIQAEVAGSRRYRVAVDFLPPPFSLTAAVMARVDEIRATTATAEGQREATQNAVLSAGPSIFPSPVQMASSCTCPEGQNCKHVVAAVHGFGAALDREPELLFALWGLAEPGPRRPQVLVVAPLPPDRPLLAGDLGALFGIDLAESSGEADAAAGDVPGAGAAASEPPVTAGPVPVASEPIAAPARSTRRGRTRVSAQATAPAIELATPPEAAPAAVHGAGGAAPEPATTLSPAAVSPLLPARRVPPCEQPEASREYLQVLGLSNRQINAWVREGVLGRTDRKDVFLRTPEANRRIVEFLAV